MVQNPGVSSNRYQPAVVKVQFGPRGVFLYCKEVQYHEKTSGSLKFRHLVESSYLSLHSFVEPALGVLSTFSQPNDLEAQG